MQIIDLQSDIDLSNSVNTFLSSKGSPTVPPGEVIRATTDEKEDQITTIKQLRVALTLAPI